MQVTLPPAPGLEKTESELIGKILSASLTAVDPGEAIFRQLKVSGNWLIAGPRQFDLNSYQRVFVIGLGKAARAMADAVLEVLDGRVTQAVIVTKHSTESSFPNLPGSKILIGSHPVPSEKSIAAAQEITALVSGLHADDLVICVISGGGSALFTLPVDSVSLDDLQQLTQLLLASGAAIHEMNTLRKQLDQVKGGGLACMVRPATLITMILSDVVGNPLDIIASGPTVPDTSTTADCLGILKKYGLMETAPQSILTFLRQKQVAEGCPDNAHSGSGAENLNLLVGSNEIATQAALETAQDLGFYAEVLGNGFQGEARIVGKQLAERLLQAQTGLLRPFCLIAGGETTVTLTGHGKGGRNQEVAAGAIPVLAGHARAALVTLATDGEDGPTTAAGAVVTGETDALARTRGQSLETALAENNLHPFFDALGSLLITGPTGTNVNDITFLFGLTNNR